VYWPGTFCLVLEISSIYRIVNKLMKTNHLFILQLLCLLLLPACATKYLISGNRFITPESQGEAFRGQIEFQQTGANQLTIDTNNGTVDNGVIYKDVSRSGFLFSNSLFDSFDIVWSHTGGANSMIGGKFQFLGGSRISNSTGHKASLGILFGGNEHETDEKSVEFKLTGKEYLLLYGFRVNENFFPYSSLSLATYNFSGRITSSNPLFNGLEPELVTTSRSLNGGIELSFDSFFAKVEASYQQLQTTDTKNRERFQLGYSVGYSW
jgi:hypothetical protein